MADAPRHPIFSEAEFARRWRALRAALDRDAVGCAVILDAETIFYLTGAAVAPSTFQALVIPRDGEPVYLFRYAEAATVAASSHVADARPYDDRDDPFALAAALVPAGARRVGLEYSSPYLSLGRFARLRAALGDRDWWDLSAAIGERRNRKSAEEIAMHRRACAAIERGLAAGIGAVRPGATEREIAEVVAVALLRAGADTPRIGVIGSGERLRQVHGGLSARALRPGDLVRLEMSNCVNRYWARIMRMIALGEPPPAKLRLYELLRRVQDEQLAAMRPGAIPAALDAAARAHLPAGTWQMQLSGYTLTFHEPAVIGGELDRFLVTAGETRPLAEGMVLHAYLTVEDVSISETVAITADGAERLTTYPRDFVAVEIDG